MVLQKLLDAVEAGQVDASTPRDVALLRRLQGTLAGWNEALGKGSQNEDLHRVTVQEKVGVRKTTLS